MPGLGPPGLAFGRVELGSQRQGIVALRDGPTHPSFAGVTSLERIGLTEVNLGDTRYRWASDSPSGLIVFPSRILRCELDIDCRTSN